MLVDSYGAVVGLWEGIVVAGGEDVGLVAVLFGSQAQVDYQLLCAPNAQVGVDERQLLSHNKSNTEFCIVFIDGGPRCPPETPQ